MIYEPSVVAYKAKVKVKAVASEPAAGKQVTAAVKFYEEDDEDYVDYDGTNSYNVAVVKAEKELSEFASRIASVDHGVNVVAAKQVTAVYDYYSEDEDDQDREDFGGTSESNFRFDESSVESLRSDSKIELSNFCYQNHCDIVGPAIYSIQCGIPAPETQRELIRAEIRSARLTFFNNHRDEYERNICKSS